MPSSRTAPARLVPLLVVLAFTTACSSAVRSCARRVGVGAGEGAGDETAPGDEETTCDRAPASPEELRALARLRRSFRKDMDAAAPTFRTFAELAAGDDETLVFEVGGRVGDKVTREGSKALSRPERVTWLYVELLEEVGNGGLHQYFWNSSGNCAREVRGAMEALGDRDVLAAYDRALALFPAARPTENREARWKQLEAVPSALEAWTPFEEGVTGGVGALARYVRAHAAEIDVPPDAPPR